MTVCATRSSLAVSFALASCLLATVALGQAEGFADVAGASTDAATSSATHAPVDAVTDAPVDAPVAVQEAVALPPVADGLLEVVVNLALVIAAIVAFAWIVRRLQNGSAPAGNVMRVAGALPVGPKERVLLLDVGDRQLVVGVTPGGMRTLHVLDEPLVSPASVSAPVFADRLARFLKGGRS